MSPYFHHPPREVALHPPHAHRATPARLDTTSGAEGQLAAGRMGLPAPHSLGTLVAPQGAQFLVADFFFPRSECVFPSG